MRKKREDKIEENKRNNLYNFRTDDFEELSISIDIENEIDNNKKGKISKLKIIILVIFLFICVVILASYTTNQTFRNYIDSKILRKQVTENTLETIEINSDDNPTIFAYDDYLGVLVKNTLNLYNSKAESIAKVDIDVSDAIVQTDEKYAVIAEKNGNKFYVLNNTEILWQGKVDGNILKVNINKNGYVTVIVSDSTYVSIVIVFDSDGTELFKTYLPSTYAMCAAISTDNSYLAIGEIDYSGTILKSNVRIMSIDSAELVYNYSNDNQNIIINIKYYDKENATCVYTNSVVTISPSNGNKIYDITESTCFVDNQMTGNLIVLEKQSSGLFSYEYNLKIKLLGSNNENLYILNKNLPSQLKTSEKLIALNYGNEVDIVSLNGTLKKNYTSAQQIKDIVVGNGIAGIIYKDKIEVMEV